MISKGNHVKFARFVFLPSVKKQKHELNFFFIQCIIKQLLHSVFVISRIIKVLVRVISLSLRLITLTSTLIILDITKTSSNNCLKCDRNMVHVFCSLNVCSVNILTMKIATSEHKHDVRGKIIFSRSCLFTWHIL